MKTFRITLRTANQHVIYWALARSSAQVAEQASILLGDAPCGVTVRRVGSER